MDYLKMTDAAITCEQEIIHVKRQIRYDDDKNICEIMHLKCVLMQLEADIARMIEFDKYYK